MNAHQKIEEIEKIYADYLDGKCPYCHEELNKLNSELSCNNHCNGTIEVSMEDYFCCVLDIIRNKDQSKYKTLDEFAKK